MLEKHSNLIRLKIWRDVVVDVAVVVVAVVVAVVIVAVVVVVVTDTVTVVANVTDAYVFVVVPLLLNVTFLS